MAKILRNIDQIIDTQGNDLTAPVLSFRNRIINGNFDIWQRGTSFTISNSTNTYSTDRWRFLGTVFTGTLTRENFDAGQTEVPNNPDYFAKWIVTTNPAGNMAFGQYIENVRTLAGKTATLSLYLKSSSTISANSLQIRYRQVTGGTGGTNNSINIGEITTSWQKFTFQLNIPSLVGETLGAPNVSYLGLDILSPTAHTTAFDLSIAQVQLEEGTAATPFEHRSVGAELNLCQRYFQQGPLTAFPTVFSSNSTYFATNFRFTTPMRVTPSLTFFAPSSGNVGKIEQWGGTEHTISSVNVGGNNAGVPQVEGIMYVIISSGIAVSVSLGAVIKADAEL